MFASPYVSQNCLCTIEKCFRPIRLLFLSTVHTNAGYLTNIVCTWERTWKLSVHFFNKRKMPKWLFVHYCIRIGFLGEGFYKIIRQFRLSSMNKLRLCFATSSFFRATYWVVPYKGIKVRCQQTGNEVTLLVTICSIRRQGNKHEFATFLFIKALLRLIIFIFQMWHLLVTICSVRRQGNKHEFATFLFISLFLNN
jgi:hypothetical protein